MPACGPADTVSIGSLQEAAEMTAPGCAPVPLQSAVQGAPMVGWRLSNKENSMRTFTRLSSLAVGSVAFAMLAACSSYGPTYGAAPTYSTAPTYGAPASYPVAGTEYGRIVNIEYLPVGTNAAPNNSIL